MLFNSVEYFLFLPAVFAAYWFIFNKQYIVQNLLILISSYVFYGWWDWRFLSLIILSTIVDFFVGLKIFNVKSKETKKIYLWVSILFNLSVLGFFKYFNFFIDSWITILSAFGFQNESVWTLNVILPVGISFYTFQTMSYTMDIYYGKLKPTKDFISFASFVSFFPQLVAGPIERASNLLPQILTNRIFQYKKGVKGLRLILWGMFKKVVIADSLSWRVDYCFNNFEILDGGSLLLGLIYFSIQIYCDFSGYSDIAIGTAKLFGIDLKSNFKFPYFSRNIAEFWRRWHISLSSWFKDYLYIPLGGSKEGVANSIRNIFVIFILSGFWHGANWTFIIWGLCHASFYLPTFLSHNNRKYVAGIVSQNSWLPSIKELIKMITTFLLTTTAWVFFRSENIYQSIDYLQSMAFKISIPLDNRSGVVFVILLLIMDWSMRKNEQNPLNFSNKHIRRFSYIILGYTIIAHFRLIDLTKFLYFQF